MSTSLTAIKLDTREESSFQFKCEGKKRAMPQLKTVTQVEFLFAYRKFCLFFCSSVWMRPTRTMEKEMQRTPALLPGESYGRRSLVGYSPCGRNSQTRLSDFTFTFHFHALENEMAAHSSILAWRIPGTEEPGGLPSMGSHRVEHDWRDLAAAAAAAAPI